MVSDLAQPVERPGLMIAEFHPSLTHTCMCVCIYIYIDVCVCVYIYMLRSACMISGWGPQVLYLHGLSGEVARCWGPTEGTPEPRDSDFHSFIPPQESGQAVRTIPKIVLHEMLTATLSAGIQDGTSEAFHSRQCCRQLSRTFAAYGFDEAIKRTEPYNQEDLVAF